MFTGIVETTAKVLKKSDSGLTIERPHNFDDVNIGSSIAVSGVCLSVVAMDECSLSFDVIGETWRRTNLGAKNVGDAVNLERSMKVSDRFEGHIVQGHIEGTANVIDSGKDGEWTTVTVDLPKDLVVYVIQKGSIAIDGVSLTVAKLEGSQCTVALIPHTLAITTFGSLKVGDSVNIETDVMARYILASRS